MDQDREVQLQRSSMRRKTLTSIDSAPNSQLSGTIAKPKRKRKAADVGKRSAKKRSLSVDGEEETPPRDNPGSSQAGASTAASSPTPSSPLSPLRALAGPSASTVYKSDGEEGDEDEDEEIDLGTALNRHKVEMKIVRVFGDDSDLSAPSSPEPPRWKKTVHPGVESGDTCLVKHSRCWFPAKLLQFKPGKAEGEKDFYEVETQDGCVYHPSRKAVLFLYEGDAIARAKIGHYAISPDPKSRVTPAPLADDATEYERFRALELPEQVGRLHAHLEAVAAEQYAPAQWRIDAFHAGTVKRAELNAEIAYGDFRDGEARTVSALLSEWVGRHAGSGRFASLAEDERSQFAGFVLLPETIIAICRRSFDLDSASAWLRLRDIPPREEDAEREEARMYALARDKLAELREHDHATEWERRREEVKRTQVMAQKTAGKLAEPARPEGRRAARLRHPEEAEREAQATMLERFARKKNQADSRKAKALTSASADGVANGEEPGEGAMADTAESSPPTNTKPKRVLRQRKY
ncbi:hypothetical protein CC85DRAFT_289775 [Cutaneotrichosporon oleaginosum]|uniref:PWWP domain-containing protein n=1 Tax=Cutaneotrichosporon oleaginosum TaxID=879819 RepID=A0A0J0XZM1_9TREE|nr:uncharacterized protein CC85DRAFT_289775 [Cutaneotrichosporon oleaginosum]KLT46485.1 hypothetical protein CC85DRAFT_289775 [Cutaneotrichosporon oleaginosum]TXT15148.1 hypothetical protein COLE_01341 [Cutaneotrichosporon oleaginosum]